jgi:hypothetical protein
MGRWIALGVAGMMGCSPGPQGNGGTASTSPSGGGAEQTRTYHADIAPLVDAHCTRCHDGQGVGLGDFTTFQAVHDASDRMWARIEAGEMPPPASDPDCHDYQGSEGLFLDDDEAAVFADWIEDGRPEGDPATAPEPTGPPRTLEGADITPTAAGPWKPAWDLGGNNEYRCFVLDTEFEEDTFINGLEFVLGQVAISHHAILFIDYDGDSTDKVTDPATQSFSCPDVQPDPDWWFLHGWAPGAPLTEFPPDLGVRVDKGSKLVLQMHYWLPDEAANDLLDQPGYRMRTTPEVNTEVILNPLGPAGFTIPAGAKNFSVEESYNLSYGSFDIRAEVWGVAPHMHVLGKKFHVWTDDPVQGRTCLAKSDGWDFDNQYTYQYDSPVVIPPDGTIGVKCTWDNSADNPDQLYQPPIDIGYGERTDEEMCFALTYMALYLE